MTNTYLPAATDFTDMEKRPLPSALFSGMEQYTVECPKCHGYGGWNLKLDAYAKNVPDATPEQRHFRAMCGQCWGWGWVESGPDAECVHDFAEVTPDQPWRCWHTIECKTCGRRRSYDSSD